MLGSLIFSRRLCGWVPLSARAWSHSAVSPKVFRISFVHKSLGDRYSVTTRAMVRYCVGAMPTWAEKKCVK